MLGTDRARLRSIDATGLGDGTQKAFARALERLFLLQVWSKAAMTAAWTQAAVACENFAVTLHGHAEVLPEQLSPMRAMQ